MSNNLYEQIKAVIKEHEICPNYNWFEKACPDKTRGDYDTGYYYFEEICEKERDFEGDYYSIKSFDQKSKNRIYYEEKLYNNSISISLSRHNQQSRYTDENRVFYHVTTEYTFDKEFVKEQSPIYMIWFVNKFNETFNARGYGYTIYPSMLYDHTTNELSVFTRLELEKIAEEMDFFDIRSKVNKLLNIGTFWDIDIWYNHFCEKIYECIDCTRADYEVAVEDFLYYLPKTNMPSGEEFAEQYINMFEKTYLDFINESKDCGLEQYRDDE